MRSSPSTQIASPYIGLAIAFGVYLNQAALIGRGGPIPNAWTDQAHTFMHAIEFTAEAMGDLRALRKFEQNAVLNGLEAQLQHAPTVETRNRKRLRPNLVADWELRIGRFRVFYTVDTDRQMVSIEAIGFKIGSQLFVRGKETNL